MIWSDWPICLARRLNRWPTGCPHCNAPAPRAYHSFSFEWIRPAPSPNATLQHGCNLPALVGPARFGMCIRPLKPRAVFCANWQKPQTACAISAWHAISPDRVGRFMRQCNATRLVWGVKSNMPLPWYMQMTWRSARPALLRLLAFLAAFANAPPATSVPSHHWNARLPSMETGAACCPMMWADPQRVAFDPQLGAWSNRSKKEPIA